MAAMAEGVADESKNSSGYCSVIPIEDVSILLTCCLRNDGKSLTFVLKLGARHSLISLMQLSSLSS